MQLINFKKELIEVKFLNPFLGFKLDTQPIEFRKDPLLNDWCRINLKRTERLKQLKRKKEINIKEIIESSKDNCFFCKNNIEKSTPLFQRNLIPEGRLKRNQAYLFPNLFPFGKHHAVAIFSGKHYLSLNEFSPELIENCLKLVVEYIKRIRKIDPKAKYCSINWNHLFPAGASILHPHLQVLIDEKPSNRLKRLIKASKKFYEKNKLNYWNCLIKAEKSKNERFINDSSFLCWIASYAPQGNNEIEGIFLNASNILEINDSGFMELCDGLSRILKYYHRIGIKSFNMSIFSGPLNKKLNYFNLNLKIISRPCLELIYTNDSGFMERIHYEPIIETKPEALAKELKNLWKDLIN